MTAATPVIITRGELLLLVQQNTVASWDLFDCCSAAELVVVGDSQGGSHDLVQLSACRGTRVSGRIWAAA